MNTRKTVYNKLFKEETKLATHEVQLALLDEFSTLKSNATLLIDEILKSKSMFSLLFRQFKKGL